MNASFQDQMWVYSEGRLQPFSASESDATLAEIASFADLSVGWHYGEGAPIPQKTINLARMLVGDMRAVGLSEIDAFAGCNGEISLLASSGEYDIEAIVENDDTVSVAHDFKAKQVSYKAHLTYDLAIKEISAVMGKAWSTSGYFIRGTIVSRRSGSPTSPFVTWAAAQMWKEAFLLSTMIASNRPAQASPSIFEPTTATSPWSRLSFGNSIPRFFPPLVAQSAFLLGKATPVT